MDIPLISSSVQEEVKRRLAAVEQEHGVKILFCCESGSRAWGFASPDSDYDVRFIYVRPQDWYLSFDVETRKDVIEYPIVDEIDCSGWDLRKALYLFTRTNGALLEWLNSPIRYMERGDLAARLRSLAPQAINDVALCYHYSHMARNNAREHLGKAKVKMKKYFYVLRPLLAIRYIQAGRGIPPVEFEKLMDAVVPTEIKGDIEALLEQKRRTPEFGLGDRVEGIERFVTSEFESHNEQFKGQGRPDILEGKRVREALNEIFRNSVHSSWA
ncbi:nucleotidyltransferase domain-containing protein [Microbulbifer guangxiensis]|uniref:nucleotidyltransferase domain-containing protein n=1 Tax=Microbulbifer guangxiensis TaxID=2904249 RepID=UPI001F3A3657|nr:nucleotidyltransferase domain-containing protein [Microbulbifer guangxiensis]